MHKILARGILEGAVLFFTGGVCDPRQTVEIQGNPRIGRSSVRCTFDAYEVLEADSVQILERVNNRMIRASRIALNHAKPLGHDEGTVRQVKRGSDNSFHQAY